MRWILLKGGHVFDPKDRGTADVLTLGREIAVVGPDLTEPRGVGDGEVVEVSHRILLPGLIDPHIHVMGASGLGGPTTRSTDLQIERITTAGVTTVVSPLGADSLTRSIPCLLARAAALECEGISAYCYTGGWWNPVPTVSGNPQADVAYVDRILGVKVAVSEPMAPTYTIEELCRLAHAAWTGGRLAGKRAVLHAHAGDLPDGLMPIREVQRRTGIPADSLMVTHVNRNPALWRQAMEFASAGGSIDLTTMQRPETLHVHAIPAAKAITEAIAAGVPAARMTLSTDSGVPYPKLDASGSAVGLYMAGPDAILETIRELVQVGFSWGSAAAFATANTASVLGLSRKGRLVAGTDADILILEADGRVDRVYARGRELVRGGQPLVLGPFGSHDA
ncbi:MAG: iadA [candidate division NC10 bacterium]|nr:iadA [candidate division NC10 bacterium]